ncbi:MAG: DUF4190 domain-containing protein, partial [Verrucomicrobiota bacterium]
MDRSLSHSQRQPMNRRPTRPNTPAVLSLVLGIIGLCLPILLSVPAVILGHLGLRKISRSNGEVGGSGLCVAGLILGYLGTGLGLVYLVFYTLIGTSMSAYKKSAAEPFQMKRPVVTEFPALPEFRVLPSGVSVGQVEMAAEATGGQPMDFRIYLPKGVSPTDLDGSLPCVLNCPAGTNLLQGARLGILDDDSYHDEALPYAEAGIVTVMYSLDGDYDEDTDDEDRSSMTEAYQQFKKAGAGTINGRNALDFVLTRLPMVDEGRIFAAGHSSAGTLALLLGAHEPRLRGVLAYCPCVDVEAFHAEMVDEPLVGLLLPGIDHFAKRSSPMTHVESV